MRYVNKFNALQTLTNISDLHSPAFGNTENGISWHSQSTDNQHLYFYQILSDFTGKEKDSESGYYAFGARYYDPDLSGLFLSVDPMSDKYPSISPYSYCAWNPVKLVDPDGEEITDFKDALGNLIKHIEDGSDAVFILQNALWDAEKKQMVDKNGKTIKPNNAFFKFSEGAQNEINIETIINFSQGFCKDAYTKDNNTYCNFATGFIIKSFVSACESKGMTIDGDMSFFFNTNGTTKSAREIYSNIKPNALYDDAVRLANERDSRCAYLSVGCFNGHVVTFTANADNNKTILNVGGKHGNTYQNGSWLNNTTYTNGSKTKYYTIGAYK